MINLNTPVEKIPRVNLLYAKRLRKLGVKTIKDLLFHFPHRYEDFSRIMPISQIQLGKKVAVSGKILDIQNIKTFRRRMNITEAIIEDKSGSIRVVWFNQPFLIKNLKSGLNVNLAGKASYDGKTLYLSNPVYEIIRMNFYDYPPKTIHTARLAPVYPQTSGLSSRWLRYIIWPLLNLVEKIPESLPEEIRKRRGLINLPRAIKQIHFPDSKISADAARKRLAFGELFLLQLRALRQRKKIQKERAVPVPFNEELMRDFTKKLPFHLTDSQKIAAWQIFKDMGKSMPMNRLLNGDVGSGKTMVAIMAALAAAADPVEKNQVAFMAPTEVLARQHFQTICGFLKDYKIPIALLTGSENRLLSKKTGRILKVGRKNLIENISCGKTGIILGTHALIQKKVNFKNLALAVIDEQHRFGVRQRAKLLNMKSGIRDRGDKSVIHNSEFIIPHLLSMTATPIPRTLALTIYGDLDISLLKEMPEGRQKIITKIVAPQDRQVAYRFIKKEIENGRQGFVICPLIEWSPKLETKAVKEEYEKLSKKIFPEFEIAMLHGRMKPKEKESVMDRFKTNKTNLLISTSVVEVGVDVPNATVMMIEGAERFGLAQLHQFRGRVGRGEHQSHCFLFTKSAIEKTSQRLKALLSCENGFELAEKDLKIRGPGEFFGARQSGLPDLIMASFADIELIEETRREANSLLEKDPELKKYPLLAQKLNDLSGEIHLE